jgi:nanoRNase/pAp phosphatase (c-di-AMP/oligoRNAs hydrolase)
MEFGARFAKISSWLKNNQDLLTIKLWGLALENLRFNPKYGFAFSVLTREDLKTAMMAAGHQDAVLRNDFSQILHSDLFGDIAGFLSNISGAKAVMLLRQDAPGKLKGGLRTSSSDIDISLLARQLGGGGHAKASGFELAGDLEKADEGWRVV